MIRATAVVRDMAAERRSLDFRGPGLLARMPPVAENIGRRPRRETILVEPCHISNASKASGLILLDCPFPRCSSPAMHMAHLTNLSPP